MTKTDKKYFDIIASGSIEERQIIDFKSYLGKNPESKRDLLNALYDKDGLSLSAKQNQKGYDFLKNQWVTPAGKERKNNPFGYREQAILEDFEDFTLTGFYDASRYGQDAWYLPIYHCNSKTKGSFEYYYDGKVNIIG